MSRIILKQITGHCDFTRLARKMNHHSLFTMKGKWEGEWIYFIFDVICPCRHLLWQLRPVSSLYCLPDPSGVWSPVLLWVQEKSVPELLVQNNPWLHLLRRGGVIPRSDRPSWSCDNWRPEEVTRHPLHSLCSAQDTPHPQPARLGNSFSVSIHIILSAFCSNSLHCHKRLKFLNLKTRSYRAFFLWLLLLCFWCVFFLSWELPLLWLSAFNSGKSKGKERDKMCCSLIYSINYTYCFRNEWATREVVRMY